MSRRSSRLHLRGERIERRVRDAVAEREEIVASFVPRAEPPARSTTTWRSSGKRRAGERAVDGGLGRAQERQEVDVEEAVGDEQRLDVGLLQAERQLRRLEARVDRHGDGADRGGGVEQRHPGLVVAHEDADEVAASDAERVHRLGGAAHGVGAARDR